MALTPRRSARHEGLLSNMKTLTIPLERITLPSATTKKIPAESSSSSQSKSKSFPNIKTSSSPDPIPETSNHDDDDYWQDKIDTLDYCVICLERNASSERSEEFLSMNHIWSYLNVSNLFSDYIFIVEKANDVYRESKIPPMCNSCLDQVKALNFLHSKLIEINRRIATQAERIRRTMESIDFKTISSKLEGDLQDARLPFRCMSNSIQFLTQLHKRKTNSRATNQSKWRKIDSEDHVELTYFDQNGKITTTSNHSPLSIEQKLEDDDFVYETDDIGVDDVNDTDYDPGMDPVDISCTKGSLRRKSARKMESCKITPADEKSDSESRSNLESCPICNCSFSRKDKLRKHWWVSHKQKELNKEEASRPPPKGPHICQECGAKFINYSSFLFHQEHEKDKCQGKSESRQFCRICDKQFNSRKALVKHRQYEHHTSAEDIEKLKCNVCGKIFKKVGHLESHLVEHSKPELTPADKSACCEICGKIFRAAKSLSQHRSVHTGEKPFSCELCGKSFRRNTFLLSHQRTIHWVDLGETRPVCNICGKSFGNPRYLKEHMVLHGQGRTYPCDVCGRIFRKRTNMIGHKRRVHMKEQKPTLNPETGELRPICPYSHCQKVFFTKRNLSEHVRNVHANKQKFSCDSCDQKFASKYDLRYHNLEVHMVASKINENIGGAVSNSQCADVDPKTSENENAVTSVAEGPVFLGSIKDGSPESVQDEEAESDEIVDGHQLIAEIVITNDDSKS